jgi:Ca2+-binding EF-hand superfamily protein
MPAVGPRRKISINSPMKRLGLPPLLLPATLFLAAGLLAEEPKPAEKPVPPPPVRAMGTMSSEEMLRRFDTNHDGKLDEDETAAAHEAMLKERMDRQTAVTAAPGGQQFRQQMLEKFDKNHDGRLDDDERAEMQKYLLAQGLGPGGAVREELIKRFDKNGDGKLDAEETAAMQKFLQERRAQGGAAGQAVAGPAQMREFLLQQFDKNGDGKIDDTEMVELEKVTRPRMEKNPQQLQRYDTNHDGKIDDTEWVAAREQIIRLLNAPAAGPGNASAPASSPQPVPAASAKPTAPGV